MSGDTRNDIVYRGRVDADASVAFALAANDPNPRYLDGAAVHPLFTTTLIRDAQHAPETQLVEGGRPAITGSTTSLHGEHDVRILGIVRPGMELRWRAHTQSVHQTLGGVLVTLRTLVEDADGHPLVEHLWSNIWVGGTTEREIGPPRPDHTFRDAARTRPIGSARVHVDRDQAFRYAGVSFDHNPHSIDDERARAEGYSSKILQGLCTFAITSGAVVDVGAGGDPRRVRRLAGRFSAPAFPDRDLVVELYDVGTTEDGARALAFEARQGDTVVIRHGRAELVAH